MILDQKQNLVNFDQVFMNILYKNIYNTIQNLPKQYILK